MSINSLSPIDGRYQESVTEVAKCFSESGLIYQRLVVELSWLKLLEKKQCIPKVLKLNREALFFIDQLQLNFDSNAAQEIKNLEVIFNHDVKAVEYWLAQKFAESNINCLKKAIPAIHFGCTSEDINNLAINLQIKKACDQILYPQILLIVKSLIKIAKKYCNEPMLARTHGQPATPTTFGKELAVFVNRLQKALEQSQAIKLSGKINGATGNFNAHLLACPNVNWQKLSTQLINDFGFAENFYTTQIEPHDRICQLFFSLSLINSIGIDLVRDLWGYIAYDYLKLKVIKKEVGSSTMPHKVNPIDFENAEGNLGLANAVFLHLAQKLPISRFQRDLSDSTVLRNIGSAFGHMVLAWKSIDKGLSKIEINSKSLANDLNNNWEVLTEAVQIILRVEGQKDAYEQVKYLVRGKKINQKSYHQLIDKLKITTKNKKKLFELTPAKYLGIAAKLASNISEN